MKKILSIILMLVMMLTILPIGGITASAGVGDYQYDETEPNSSVSKAKRIYSDSTVFGSLYDTDLDYFKFVLYSSQKVTLLVQSSSSRIYACINDSSDDVLAVGTSSYDNGYYYDTIVKTLPAGTYYICLLNNARYYSTSYIFYFEYSSATHTHSYTNDCDSTCNTCGATRTVTHTYTNTCDSSCDVCGATRSVSHTYTNSCDTSCNVCGYTRSAEHKYTNACDSNCNVCGYSRNATHTYSNDCDTTCNVCYATRTVSGHVYSNVCDTTCDECGVLRVTSHTYTDNCDESCNICGYVRTPNHSFTNGCDDYCDECGATRTVSHSYKTTTTKATLTKDGGIAKRCSICGHTTTTTINKIASAELDLATYTFNHKVKTPTVTVKNSVGNTLKKDIDYTVSYPKGRKNVGKYKIVVTFKGNYSGTKELYFTINPVKTSVSKLTAGKKSIKVYVGKKTSQVTGYQIQYSAYKNFKSAKTKTLTSYKSTSTTLKLSRSRRIYYVRVRTYKTVNGVRYYSGWSTYKYTKTK